MTKTQNLNCFIFRSGDLQQAEVRCDEESVRAVRALRLRDRPHHLLLQQQALPVRQHRHGQGKGDHYEQKDKRVKNVFTKLRSVLKKVIK